MSKKELKYIFYFNSAALLNNLLGLIRAKITAIWLGISGVGILGQILTFYNLQTRLIDFGTFPLLINKIGKLDLDKDSQDYDLIVSITFLILLFTNIISLPVLLIFRNQLTILLFGSLKYSSLIILLAFLNPVFTVAFFPETILKAHRKFSILAKGQNLTAVVGIITIVPAIWFLGEEGIIFNFFIFLGFNAIYFFWFARFYLKISGKIWNLNFWPILPSVLKFCSIDTLRKILVFGSLVLFRIILIQFSGIENTGYFQSIWSISNYINVLMTAFMVYLFPTLSGYTDSSAFKRALDTNFQYLVYLIFPFIVTIVMAPEIFLLLLFDRSFLSMSYYLSIFTFLKIFESIYIFYTTAFLAQTRLKAFIATEATRSLTLVFFSYFAISKYSLKGAVASFIVVNLITLIPLFYYVKKDKWFEFSRSNMMLLVYLALLLTILLIPLDDILIIRISKVVFFIILSFFAIDWKKYFKLIGLLLPFMGKKNTKE